jgi:MFS family permease
MNGSHSRSHWPLLLAAAAILMITMGTRQSLGLFVSPLNSSTGLGIVAISFAMAVGQFVWGASQPVFGAVADRYGPTRVIALGAVLLAIGCALTPFVRSDLASLFGLTLLSHQIGGFFGAWLGGVALAGSGNYMWMWYADMLLALLAAVVNLPIREAHVGRLARAPA